MQCEALKHAPLTSSGLGDLKVDKGTALLRRLATASIS